MNFIKYKWFYFLISAVFLVPGMISLFLFGLQPAIDFTGGSLLEVRFLNEEKRVVEQDLQDWISNKEIIDTIQTVDQQQILFKGKPFDQSQKQVLVDDLNHEFGELEEIRFETVGPVLGKELVKKTIVAVLIVAAIVALYVAKQFKEFKFGICAILAMFHDSLVLLGSFSLFGKLYGAEVDVLFVTAILTTLSFSIHDTIVIYDRIRELDKRYTKLSSVQRANVAIVETLSRSINNSMTIIFMLLALVILGGATIKWFSLALLIGAISGTYSSTFIAVPLLLVWEKWISKK